MSGITTSIYDMRLLDDLAHKETFIHRLSPLVKLLVTLIYLVIVISLGKYEISALLPFLAYPILIFAFSDLPIKPILKRLLVVSPLIIGIGILNPLFDKSTIIFFDIEISRGWISFLSILIKYGLTVTAALLLIATTGMDKIAAALRELRVPKIFVLQLLLTYRYVSVMLEEVARTMRAYSLRAPAHKGIKYHTWSSLAGQLILRTFDRAQRVYQAMCLRGFSGEYKTDKHSVTKAKDLLYLASWLAFFIIARLVNIPMMLGLLFTRFY